MKFSEFKSSSKSQKPHLLLIGNPVSHSLSPLMHTTAVEFYGLDVAYYAVMLDSSELGSFAARLNQPQLKGVNITIPYKQLMMDYVDELAAEARRIGAVNTIAKEGQTLMGHNTDAYGFLKPLQNFKAELAGSRAIVFGTGGASKAIVYALQQLQVQQIVLVSRNPGRCNAETWPQQVQFCSYESWSAFADESSIIINATPLGMESDTGKSPIQKNEQSLLEDKICYDIVYKPQKTTFLQWAEEAGARTIGGLEMLIHQGSRSFELWTGKPFPIERVRKALDNYLSHDDRHH